MNQAPLSITFYFGTGNDKIERLTKKYIITNWQDETDLRQIMDGLAADLNYITGYGILEMLVKRDNEDDVLVDYRSQHKPHDDRKMYFSLLFCIEVGMTNHNYRKVWLNIPRSASNTGAQAPRPTNDPVLSRFLDKVAKNGVLQPVVRRQRQWNPYESVTTSNAKYKPLPKGQQTWHIRQKNLKAAEKQRKKEEREWAKAEAAGIVYLDQKQTKKANQIYLIYVVDEYYQDIYKIGMSNKPGSRLEALRTSCPFELELVHRFVATPAEDAEKQLHIQFQANNLRGEWYRLSPEQVASIKRISRFEDGQFMSE